METAFNNLVRDVAAAHAVIRKAGMDLEYYSGVPLDRRNS